MVYGFRRDGFFSAVVLTGGDACNAFLTATVQSPLMTKCSGLGPVRLGDVFIAVLPTRPGLSTFNK